MMIELYDALPKELVDILNSLDYEEDGGLRITAFKFSGDDLHVDFTIMFFGLEQPKQFWRVEIKGIKKQRIVIDWEKYPEIYSDHYLLYDFTDNYAELYFNGNANNSEKLFIDLFQLHQANYNKLEFGDYINAHDGIVELCKRGRGLFARGSRRILESYATCLAKHGIQTNFVGEREKNNSNLKLLIFEKSYFIGECFNFTKLKQTDD